MMKKVIAWLLVLALTVTVSIGATLAYLTDTDEDVNVMTLGKVKIDQLEYERVDVESKNDDASVQEFHDNKPLLPTVIKDGLDYSKPGDTYVDWEQIGKDGYTSPIWNPELINNEVDKMVFVKNKGDYDAFVRSVFAFEAGKYTTLDEFQKMVHLNLNLNTTDYTWEWVETPVIIGESTYFVATATYNKVLAPGALTEISLSQIALDSSATNEDVEAFGDTYQVLVKSQGIQADGFDNAADALDEGFGVITATNVPWDNDAPTKGIDVRTALHYLDGDNTTTAITANVSSVTFGLNKNYASVVDANTGVLVDVEQDVPVYAYYVENGSNYDIYFLADDDIYLPKDSSTLMMDMTALTAVNTENLNTSRTENMMQLFRNCAKLETLDTTNWDTSKVTSMHQVFFQCKALQSIPGIEDWETGAATTMRGMFRECGVKGDLDLSDWDVSSVTDMCQMFYKAPNLVNLDAEGWNAKSCTDMDYMFYALPKLESVNASGWNTSSVINMYAMFAKATSLETLIATGWDMSRVENVYGMFLNDSALKLVEGSGAWELSSATNVVCMFQNCKSLPSLDVTNWNLGKATDLTNMFRNCSSMVSLIGSGNWSCANVETMNVMFLGCRSLTTLDVSNWDVSKVRIFSNMFDCDGANIGAMALEQLIGLENWNVQSVENMYAMFYGCGKLKSLDLSGWNVTNLKTLGHCFTDCYALEHVDFTGWNTPNLVTMDCMFNNCESLTTVDLSSFTTDNVKEFSQLFEYCYSLQEIKGLENWNTAKGCTFTEMFSGCGSLKELNLSSFDTSGAYDHYLDFNNSYSSAFGSMFSGVSSLQKLTLGEKFRFDGNGTVGAAGYVKLPNPGAIDGQKTQWFNAETGTYYTADQIPEKVAATYVAAVPPVNEG